MFVHRRTLRNISLRIRSLSLRNLPFRGGAGLSSSVPRFKTFLFLLLLITILFFLFQRSPPYSFTHTLPTTTANNNPTTTGAPTPPTNLTHILFAVASSAVSFRAREPYLRLWYKPNSTRVLVFFDRLPPSSASNTSRHLPPFVLSGETARFPYSFPRGQRSAIRVARVVKEAVERGEEGVRWFVFGDDDTMFFPENLVSVLGGYDHEGWYYVGGRSESFEQNAKMSFDMAFGGGGFAISYPLARVLARVFDSCLMRYPHLYGSDGRISACLAELGVGFTYEPGFHQIDIRGSLFGLLTAHPLSPLLSLHHLELVDPIFPRMNRTQALEHFLKAVHADPVRIVQRSVCYDRSNNLTISVSWGYAVQVYKGNHLLLDLLPLQRTFRPWRRRAANTWFQYAINTRDFPEDRCKRPAAFYMQSVVPNEENSLSTYRKSFTHKCIQDDVIHNLEEILVSTKKMEIYDGQMKTRRRQCCDVLQPYNRSMEVNVRQCREEELISMNI